MATAQQSNSFLNYHHTYPTHVQTRKLCLPLVTALRNSMAMGQFRSLELLLIIQIQGTKLAELALTIQANNTRCY